MSRPLQQYLPKSKTDMVAFAFLIFSIHSIGLFEMFVVLPSIYKTPTHASTSGGISLYHFHMFMGILIYSNVMVNLYKVITTNTTIRGRMLPSVLRPGWRFCYACESNSPPRSFHCFTCDTCVLRRDHHCTFTGNCIGIFNHRYYIGLVSFMCLAAGYSCALNLDFIYHLVGSLSLKSLIVVLFPMVSWIFVQSDSMTSFQVFMTSLCVIGFFFSGGLLLYHIVNAVNGQIVYERTYGIQTYNLGWKENIALLLGSKWRVAWICPLIDSPIPSDGLEFVTKQQYEGLKTM